MFNNQRYCTRGIIGMLPPITQIILWELIDAKLYRFASAVMTNITQVAS